MDLENIDQQVAVITGASSGIGAAVTRNLASLGVKSIITARREEKLEKLATETGALPVAGDIRDADLPQHLLETALHSFGRCDILINNAGLMHIGTVQDLGLDQIHEMVSINIDAAFRLAYVFARHFTKQQSGYVVNISSILGTKVRATTGPYAGTKYAIEALTEALRLELAGSGVRITAVEPGLVMTELHDHWKQHPRDVQGIKAPLIPEDIAQVISFLLRQPPHVSIPRVMVLPSEQVI